MSDQSAKYWDAAQTDPRKPGAAEYIEYLNWDAAQRKERKEKEIHLRVPGKPGRKTAWVRAAQKKGVSLAEWAGEKLDEAAA